MSEQIQILQGDALAILPGIPDRSVDCVITDPPYSSGGAFRGDRVMSTGTKYQSSDAEKLPEFEGDSRDQRSFGYWCSLWMSECLRVTKPGGMFCTFVDWRQLPTVTDAMQAGGWVWRGIAVWDKINARPVPNRFKQQAEFIVWGTKGPRSTETKDARYGLGVFSFNPPPTSSRVHATQKPHELLQLILDVACPPGGTVLDPFLGSGSMAVACERVGRRLIGIEIDPYWAKVARKRFEQEEENGALFREGAA